MTNRVKNTIHCICESIAHKGQCTVYIVHALKYYKVLRQRCFQTAMLKTEDKCVQRSCQYHVEIILGEKTLSQNCLCWYFSPYYTTWSNWDVPSINSKCEWSFVQLSTDLMYIVHPLVNCECSHRPPMQLSLRSQFCGEDPAEQDRTRWCSWRRPSSGPLYWVLGTGGCAGNGSTGRSRVSLDRRPPYPRGTSGPSCPWRCTCLTGSGTSTISSQMKR